MKQHGFLFIEVLVVVGTLVVIAAMGAAVAPRAKDKARQVQSINNVRNIAIILSERSIRKGFPRYSGKNFVLSLVAYRFVDVRNPSNCEVFFSPADELYSSASTPPDRWKEITVQALKADQDFHELTSYAGRRNAERDYVITPDAMKRVVPMVCDDDEGPLHHTDGLVMGYTDGSVRFVEWAELGMARPEDANDPEPYLADDATVESLQALSSE